MNKGVVVRNDDVWQGHPDVAFYKDKLYIVYRESEKHLSAGGTRIQLVNGRIVSNIGNRLAYISEPQTICSSPHRLNCPRLSVIGDELWLVCDEVNAGGNYLNAENEESQTRVFLWKTFDGKNWEGPISTNITGIVPDRITQADGYYLIATHTKRQDKRTPMASELDGFAYDKAQAGGHLVENVWKSDDLGASNWSKYSLVDNKRFNFCEASIFPYENKYYCLLRENSGKGLPAFISVSEAGIGWSSPVPTRLFGCHRPVAGVLKSGRIFTTYRESTHSFHWKYWGKNTFAHLCDPELRDGVIDFRHGIILPLDHDNAEKSDSGYTGWVQLEDHSIFVVNYITQNAGTPHIVWYLIEEADF